MSGRTRLRRKGTNGGAGSYRIRGGGRGWVALIVPLLLFNGEMVAAGPAIAGVVEAPRPVLAVAASAEIESPDFASEVYADPWDYGNVEDQNTNSTNASNVSVADGRLKLNVTGGTYIDPVATVPGSLAYGRDGAAQSIDTSRYKRLSFRMTDARGGASSGVGAILWFSCRDMLASCSGGITFPLKAGNAIYDHALDAPSTVGARVPWSGRIVGLRVLPAITAPQSQSAAIAVEFDWMRLYAPVPGRLHGAEPPGPYEGYAIEALPQPVVDSPHPSEGLDLATAQRGRPWIFTDPANAAGLNLSNARLTGYDSRGLNATNSPPLQNDPSLALPVQQFDATAFHHFSFDLSYDGPFDLGDGPGGGKLARLIWTVAGTSTFQESDDIVTYSGVNARPVEIDLNAPATALVDPTSRPPQLGWTARGIAALRFDPNEDPGANSWRLRSLHLRADPAAAGSTTVRFHDNAWVPGTTADILVGTGAPGTPYTLVSRAVPVQQGVNSVPFSLGALPAGSYRIQVVLKRASGAAALAFSRTAISMSRDVRSDPSGALDAVRRAPGGAVVVGWARDPDTTDPIGVHTYVDGAPTAVTSADRERPDVAAAVPGAPPRTGFEQVVAMGPGAHSVCAYAINSGPGVNSLLRCGSVNIDGRAVGALDSVVGVPGGLRSSGWAIDPDTAAPIAVHVYANSIGRVTTATSARPDVARAWVGYGPAHGFSVDTPLGAGTYRVCAYGVGTNGDDNALLGCKTVSVSGAPFGNLDEVTRSGGDVSVRGWTLDPDTTASIAVHIYVDGAIAAVITADRPREDIGSAFPAFGSSHGFEASVRAGSGATVCAYAIDDGGGANTTLGCRVA